MNTTNNPTKKELTGYPSIDKPWLKYYEKNADNYVVEDQHQSIFSYLYQSNKSRLDYIALEYFSKKITYQEMINNIEKMAAAFLSMGIKQGDCVTVCLPNVPEIIYAVYSLNRIGAIASLIDPRTNANEILKRANDSNSKVLIAITNIVKAKIAPIISDLKAESVICVSPFNTFESKLIDALLYRKNSREGKYINYNEFLKRGKTVQLPEQIPFVKNSPAVIVYTSGTTGNSKGVMLSNENIVSSHRISSFGCAAVQENASFLGVIPFFVSYGAITGMNYSLCSGWKIILIPKFKASQFTKLILKHKPNSVLGVPRFWEHFADKNTNVDLSFLKNPICGGDKISPLSVQKINLYLSKHKANRLKIGYGASEFGGGIVITTEHGPYDINSTGEILPGVIGITIDPDTGEELSYNNDGELCFYSPTMMMGYYHNDDETRKITIYKDNVMFYKTGDKGHINEDGCVFIIDRYKRVMMRPDGHTVHATPIENLLLSDPSIKDCAVVGLKMDVGSGVIPTAFLNIDENIETNIQALISRLNQLCRNNLPGRDLPMAYIIVEQIPYTLMGKVDFRKLEEKSICEVNPYIVDFTFVDKNGFSKL